MKTTRKILLYALYAAGVTGFFLYYLFPAEAVRDYVAHQVGRAEPNLSLTIAAVAPGLPPGLTFESAELFHEGRPVATADRIKVTPSLTSLMRQDVVINFHGRIYDGRVKGAAVVPRKGPAGRLKNLEAVFSGVQIGGIEALSALPGYQVTGKLNADIAYHPAGKGPTDGDGANAENNDQNNAENNAENNDGNIRFVVLNLVARPSMPLFGIEQIQFTDVQGEAILANPGRVEVKSLAARGGQVNVSVTGAINLARPLNRSALNLTGTITPHPSFIAALGDGFPAAFLMKKRGGGQINFRIGGTLENPAFSLL